MKGSSLSFFHKYPLFTLWFIIATNLFLYNLLTAVAKIWTKVLLYVAKPSAESIKIGFISAIPLDIYEFIDVTLPFTNKAIIFGEDNFLWNWIKSFKDNGFGYLCVSPFGNITFRY